MHEDMTPFFSVVLPVYNKASTLARALKSVIEQTYQNYEIIVVNDGSTDKSLTILESIARKCGKIKVFTQKNVGVSAARNRGVHESRGMWIAFLDADDIWMPEMLSELHSLIREFPSSGIVGTSYYRQNGDWFSIRVRKIKNKRSLLNFFSSFCPLDMPYHTSSTAVKREFLIQEGGYDEKLSFYEDAELLFRLAMRHPAAYSTIPLSIYTDDAPIKITRTFRGTTERIPWPHIELLERLCQADSATSDQTKCGRAWLLCALSNAQGCRLRWSRVVSQFPALFRKLPIYYRIRMIGVPILFCRRLWCSALIRVQRRRYRLNEVVRGI